MLTAGTAVARAPGQGETQSHRAAAAGGGPVGADQGHGGQNPSPRSQVSDVGVGGTSASASPQKEETHVSQAATREDAQFNDTVYRRIVDTAAARMKTLPAGDVRRVAAIRFGAEAAYYLTWDYFDKGDDAQAQALVQLLSTWLAPFDQSHIPNELRLPLARLLWLQSRLANERKDEAEDKRLRARALELTADRASFLPDYGGLSKMRIAALSSVTGPDADARGREARSIVAELEAAAPGSMSVKLVECDVQKAQAAIAAKRFAEADKDFAHAEKFLAAARKTRRANAELKMAVVASRDAAAALASTRDDPAAEVRLKIEAAKLFSEALRGHAYRQSTTDQVHSLFNTFSNLDLGKAPGVKDKLDQARLQAALFGDMADALEPSRTYFVRSRYVAGASVGAANQAAMAYTALSRPVDVLHYADMAIKAAADANLLNKMKEFDEDGQWLCSAYAKKVEALIVLKRTDEAIGAYQDERHQCGDWLKRFPWDFYARSPLNSSTYKLGDHLADLKRFPDAVPLLQYASDWGFRDASKRLATIYRDSGDAAKADRLTKFANGQRMERFTIPTDFAGKSYPFYVYVEEYADGKRCPSDRALQPDEENCIGFVGIDDQATWVKEARGGTVPADVITSFHKLYNIAHENNVSFVNLTVYALGAAREADTNATPEIAKTIFEEMQRTGFYRSPLWLLDPAGVALNGYDPVSYFKGDKPAAGRADLFALWDGAVWLFANADNRAAFLRDPRHFAPQYGGFAAFEIAEGKQVSPAYDQFLVKQGGLYLFDAEEDKLLWSNAFDKRSEQASAEWIKLDLDQVATETKLGGMILKLGKVRVANGLEKIKGDLPRYSLAVSAAEKLGPASPNLVAALGRRSWSYVLLGRADDALTDTDRALKIDPNAAWIAGNRADALVMKGQSAPAAALYRSISDKLGPDGKTPMCRYILLDFQTLKTERLAAPDVVEQAGKDVPCRPEAPPAPTLADTNATAEIVKRIFGDMQRTKFFRNPLWLSDRGGVALKGFDPVAYAKAGKPVAGHADLFALWDGAVWLFSSADNRAAFLRDPRGFAPQYGGFAASEVAEAKAASPEHDQFLVRGGKLYLFDAEEDRSEWLKDFSKQSEAADAGWLKLNVHHVDAETKLGGMIVKLGRVRDPSEAEEDKADLTRRSLAVTQAEKTGPISPQLVSALGNRSWAYLLLGRVDDALADIDRALKIDPNAAWIVGNKADALLIKGRYDQASAIYRSIADKPGPDDKTPMCHFILQDLETFRGEKLANSGLIDRVRRSIPCQQETPPPAAENRLVSPNFKAR